MKKLLLIVALALASLTSQAVNPFLEFQPVQAGDDYVSFNVQGGFKIGRAHV